MVRADDLGDFQHIRPYAIADIGHFINEGDFHRQEGVGRIFGQLCAPQVHMEEGNLLLIQKRLVDALQNTGGAFAASGYNPLGMKGIIDRPSLAEKLRIGGNVHHLPQPSFAHLFHKAVRRPYGNRALVHQKRGCRLMQQCFQHIVEGFMQIGKVGGAVGIGRRSHCDKHHIRFQNGFPVGGGEGQAGA
ncbi:hypothetical protein D3C75_884950 [compost metagenome]